MVSIRAVYEALKDLANKDQKGFITPGVFNNFAGLAQLNIYNELFQELVKAKQLQRSGFNPGRDKSVRKQTLEDLSYFVNTVNLNSPTSDGLFNKPENLSKIISISEGTDNRSEFSFDNTDRTYNIKNIEIVYDVEKMDRILSSNLSTPTEDFPVALVSNVIEVFPNTINRVRLTYYRKPGSIQFDGDETSLPPTYSETQITGNLFVFDPQNSTNFMLPSHYDNELVMEMAKLIGVRLRDPNITGYAVKEEASE